MKKHKYSIPLAIMAGLAMFTSSAHAQTTYSNENFNAATSDVDWGNTDYSRTGGSGHSLIKLAAIAPAGSDGNTLRMRNSSADANIVLDNAMSLATDGIISLEVAFDVRFDATGTYGNPAGNSLVLVYSASGLFDDTTSIQIFSDNGAAPADLPNYKYTQLTWYTGQTVTILPGDVTGGFTDTAKIRWDKEGAHNQDKLDFDNVVIRGFATFDTTPPTPHPMTWASAPAPYSETKITMEASLATDPEGYAVQYRFNNTTLATNSGWQSSRTFIDTGLVPSTPYSYTVEARDAFTNATAPSAPAVSATTLAPDMIAPPTPAFTVAPNAVSFSEITMTAGAVVDPGANDVEYYFTATSGDGHDSGWQASPEYTDSGLKPETSSYEYTVMSRDLSLAINVGAPSAASSPATTPAVPSDQILYSFEDWEAAALGERPVGAIAGTDYDNTSTDPVTLNESVVVVADSDIDYLQDPRPPGSVGPHGQHMKLLYRKDNHITTQTGLLPLLTGNLESLDISFSVRFREVIPTDFKLEYSALGDFTDAVEFLNITPGGEITPGGATYEEDTWYHLWVTILAADVAGNGGFTDTAKLRWRTQNHAATYLDDVIIVGNTSTPASNDYTDWIADFPGVGVLTGFNDDADNDGNSNGLESYYGTDPSVFTAGVVSGGLSGNTFTFTHPLNETPLDDISGAYLWSTDLETFYADGGDNGAGTTVTFVQGAPSAGMVTVTATITGPVPAKLFVNIEVTQP